MRLKGFLRNHDDTTLREIAGYWGIIVPGGDGADKDVVVETLAQKMPKTAVFRKAFAKLSEAQRNTLYFLALHGGELTESELVGRCFGAEPDTGREVVESLRRSGFAFDAQLVPGRRFELVALPESFVRLIELPTHWQGYLGAFMASIASETLAAIAARVLTGKQASGSRTAVLHRVRKALLDPDFLRRYIDGMPAEEKELLQTVIAAGGCCLYRDLLDPEYHRNYDHARASLINGMLDTSGVLYVASEGHNKYANLLMMPRDLYHVITTDYCADTRGLRELDTVSVDSRDFMPTAVRDNSQTLLRDVVILARFIDSQHVKPLSDGGISRADLKRALGQMSAHKSVRYAEFLAAFLEAKELIVRAGEVWKTAESFARWLENPNTAYLDILAWWAVTTEWDEGTSGTDMGRSAGTGWPVGVDIVAVRKAVVDAIAAIPGEKWISLAPFIEMLLPQIKTILPLSGSGRGAQQALRRSKAAVKSVVSESLLWLGTVALGSPDGSFQLTDLGRASLAAMAGLFWSREGQPPGCPDMLHYDGSYLIVQPNLEIIAPPDFSLGRFFTLVSFCDVKNVDVMTTLKLTRESVKAGFDQGLRGEDVLAFLEETSRTGVPETVRKLIEDCSTKHGEVHIGLAGGYLRVDHPVVLEEIRSNRRLRALLRETGDEKLMLLATNADLRKLERELESMGLMPRMESDIVQKTRDERYHLILAPHELHDVMAAVRFLAVVEEVLGSDITRGKSGPLIRKLREEIASFYHAEQSVEQVTRLLERHFRNALNTREEEMTAKYKEQFSRLVSSSIGSRRPSRHGFCGPNPAAEPEDIRAMLTYACEHELEVAMRYLKEGTRKTRLTILPRSLEGTRLYATCTESDSDAIYSIERIVETRLL